MNMSHPKSFWARFQPASNVVKGCAAFGVGVLVLASADAQVTQSGNGYLLRTKYTKGQTLKYTTTSSVQMPPQGNQPAQPLRLEMPIVLRVTEVNAKESKIEATLGPATMGGSQVQPATKMDMALDNRNRASASGARTLVAELPDKPVRVGETWTTNAPIPDMVGGGASGTVNATYKFNGLKTINNRRVAEITYTLSGGAKGNGTIHVLASDGTLWSNTASIQLAQGGGPPLNIVMTMRRA
jgi:hypothetical protein